MSEIKYLEQPYESSDRPLWFHRQGLSETASGYGRRLRSTRMIRLAGEQRWRRVYVICYSNAGSAYVRIKGEQYFLHACG